MGELEPRVGLVLPLAKVLAGPEYVGLTSWQVRLHFENIWFKLAWLLRSPMIPKITA